MKKMRLDLSAVRVESFSMEAIGSFRQGTVLAQEDSTTSYSGEVSCLRSCVSGCSCPPGY
jgi:hypothetical protein